MSCQSTLIRLGTLVIASCCLVLPKAFGTWSICAVDVERGEIAIGSATCLSDFNLKTSTPVLRVGKGVGVAQAFLGPVSLRQIMWNELGIGTHPQVIMDLLEQADSDFQTRQYGIVDLQGRVAVHTGNQAGAWAGHRTGTVGSITYSIQGNVLTGEPVVLEAEHALLQTPGTLADKLMASMLAARAMGGDGRCSCSPPQPDSCGAPPPNFTHSAYVGYMLVTRIGDIDGANCNNAGCAKGTYYLDLNVPDGNPNLPDPVFRLWDQFQSWRDGLDGVPDHYESRASLARPTLPTDGTTETLLNIELRDWQGDLIGQGGQTLEIEHAPPSDGITSIGGTVDHGDGTYETSIQAGSVPGLDQFEVAILDGPHPITLYPYPQLPSVPLLQVDSPTISSSQPSPVTFTWTEPGDVDHSSALLMMSVSGSIPGMDLGAVHVPLNYDGALLLSILHANQIPFVETRSQFNGDGQHMATFAPLPGWLELLVGHELTFAFITLNPIDAASNAVSVFVTP